MTLGILLGPPLSTLRINTKRTFFLTIRTQGLGEISQKFVKVNLIAQWRQGVTRGGPFPKVIDPKCMDVKSASYRESKCPPAHYARG